ncbi:hypothetical protein [Paenibacillus glucanolyticus]|uniref:hypothetical protein n=1 Tax=Paenibacillus glucanolyticus TaxID=59843 RepID=UPI0015C40D60|nr:hypothetical protein [Paenibacillus glucanolyticus]
MKKQVVLSKISALDAQIREVEAQISVMTIKSVREKMEKHLKDLHKKADKLAAELKEAK